MGLEEASMKEEQREESVKQELFDERSHETGTDTLRAVPFLNHEQRAIKWVNNGIFSFYLAVLVAYQFSTAKTYCSVNHINYSMLSELETYE